MNCPCCEGKLLRKVRIRGANVEIDSCSKCNGVWFDADELNAVLPVASKDLQVPWTAKSTELTCPRCDCNLSSFSYPQTYVEIDMCKRCRGVWIHKKEFKEIKTVRNHLQDQDELDAYAPVVGLKGVLLSWINNAIEKTRQPED